jgi:hypothetical protein
VKAPLPVFVEELYFKRFGKHRPDTILPNREAVSPESRKEGSQAQSQAQAEGRHNGLCCGDTQMRSCHCEENHPDPEHSKAGTVCNRLSASPDE